MSLWLAPSVIVPFGKLADLAGIGYGANISFVHHNLFFEGLTAGIDLGGYYITGVDSLEDHFQKTDILLYGTVSLRLGYRFDINENIFITPFIAGGGRYIKVDYVSRHEVTLEDTEKTLSEFGAQAYAGITAAYKLNDTIYFFGEMAYGSPLVKDDTTGFAYLTAGTGIGYLF